MLFLILLVITPLAQALQVLLPPLTGPSLVGTTSLELVDYTRIEPQGKDVEARDLMVSVWYPVQHVRRYHLAPSFTPVFATFLDNFLKTAPGVAGSVISRAYEGAHLHSTNCSQPDVLLFSPGQGASRVEYTALLSSLASYGYIVIGVDHPYDTGFIDYPDNRTAIAAFPPPIPTNSTVDIRVADMKFVLDSLTQDSKITRKIPGLHRKINLSGSKVGIFGHSLGGATAASTMFGDSRFSCGINLDGQFFGPVIDTGLSQPFLLVSSEGHGIKTDDTWVKFFENSKGFKLDILINGSSHIDFLDWSFLYEELKGTGLVPDVGNFIGPIGGKRMLEIDIAYIRSFFDMCLKGGQGTLLKGPSRNFSEVIFQTA